VFEDNLLGWSAELAYFSLFAVFPALLFIAALGSFLATPGAIPTLLEFWAAVAPQEITSLIDTTLQDVLARRRGGLLSVGAAVALWGGASGMSSLFKALNAAYGVRDARSWVRVRLLALGTTVAVSACLLVAVALTLAGEPLVRATILWLGWTDTERLLRALRWLVTLAAIGSALTLVYYVGPNVAQRWRDVLPGTAWAALAWVGASLGLSAYLRWVPSYHAYGLIGALIVLLLWLYVISLVVLVGGLINAHVRLARPLRAARR
jgi:membrane protein